MTKEYFQINLEETFTTDNIDDLVKQYNEKTDLVIQRHRVLVNLRKLKDDYESKMNNAVGKNMTKKRLIEMALNKNRSVKIIIDNIKLIFIFVGILLITLIFYRFKLMTYKYSFNFMGSWCISGLTFIFLSIS